MAESPLAKLARVVGGVALLQGRFGAQMLGNLLVTNTTAVELAGVNVAIAATARRRNAFAQAAVGTAAPALAVQGLARREEKRLERISKANTEALQHEQATLMLRWSELERRRVVDAERIVVLEQENAELRERLAQLDAVSPPPVASEEALFSDVVVAEPEPLPIAAVEPPEAVAIEEPPRSPAIDKRLVKSAKATPRGKGGKRR